MEKLVFATNNAHKLQEVRQILGDEFEVLSLADIGCDVDIPETGTTLEENAMMKAQYIFDRYHIDVFADDTGLEVEALNGAPGVYSARYAAMEEQPAAAAAATPAAVAPSAAIAPSSAVAPGGFTAGKSHDSEANMSRLLRELGENNNRRARFRTVVALIQMKGTSKSTLLEGIVNGEITRERSGAGGFGYDPIFRPDGYDKTFADLGAEVKNQIGHRARAIQKLCAFLKNT